MNARTQNEIFQQFKAEKQSISWSNYWMNLWHRSIDLYIRKGWHMIALGHRNKRPIAGIHWDSYELTLTEALIHVEQGGNLGIVADDDLVLLDYDSREIPQKLLDPPTMKMVTPNGFIIFTKSPYDERIFMRLKRKFKGFDLPRTSIMYVVAPLSITCTQEKKDSHKCDKHDYRVREWLNGGEELLTFSEYARMVLK